MGKIKYVVYDISQLNSHDLNVISGGIVCIISMSDKHEKPRYGLLLAAKLQQYLTLTFNNDYEVEIKQLNRIVELFNYEEDDYFQFDVLIGGIEQRLSIQKMFQHWEKKKKSSVK